MRESHDFDQPSLTVLEDHLEVLQYNRVREDDASTITQVPTSDVDLAASQQEVPRTVRSTTLRVVATLVEVTDSEGHVDYLSLK